MEVQVFDTFLADFASFMSSDVMVLASFCIGFFILMFGAHMIIKIISKLGYHDVGNYYEADCPEGEVSYYDGNGSRIK